MITNYYIEIKDKLINNEVYKSAKDYSKNRSNLITYYEVGKLLSEAGKQYGEGIIKEYSKKLTSELGKKYSYRTLFRMKQFYSVFNNKKVSTMWTLLPWSIIRELLSMDENKINYYMMIVKNNSLSVRQLRARIKSNEYERLDEDVRLKLVRKEKNKIEDFIKNPILIKNSYNYKNIREKIIVLLWSIVVMKGYLLVNMN